VGDQTGPAVTESRGEPEAVEPLAVGTEPHAGAEDLLLEGDQCPCSTTRHDRRIGR
jgi:hypothetical protein